VHLQIDKMIIAILADFCNFGTNTQNFHNWYKFWPLGAIQNI
jgi:hypothetical protein